MSFVLKAFDDCESCQTPKNHIGDTVVEYSPREGQVMALKPGWVINYTCLVLGIKSIDWVTFCHDNGIWEVTCLSMGYSDLAP